MGCGGRSTPKNITFDGGCPKKHERKGGGELERNSEIIPKNSFKGCYVTKTGKLGGWGSYNLEMTPHPPPSPFHINEQSLMEKTKQARSCQRHHS